MFKDVLMVNEKDIRTFKKDLNPKQITKWYYDLVITSQSISRFQEIPQKIPSISDRTKS